MCADHSRSVQQKEERAGFRQIICQERHMLVALEGSQDAVITPALSVALGVCHGERHILRPAPGQGREMRIYTSLLISRHRTHQNSQT